MMSVRDEDSYVEDEIDNYMDARYISASEA